MLKNIDDCMKVWPLLTMLQVNCICAGDPDTLDTALVQAMGWLPPEQMDAAEAELATLTGAQIHQVFRCENGDTLPFAPLACAVMSFMND